MALLLIWTRQLLAKNTAAWAGQTENPEQGDKRKSSAERQTSDWSDSKREASTEETETETETPAPAGWKAEKHERDAGFLRQ